MHGRCAGLNKAVFARVSKSSSTFCYLLCHLITQEKEIETLRICVSYHKSSVSDLESKLNSVMNSLSMTASHFGMDPQQISVIAAPGASYVQITRNSMSIR